MSDPTSERFKIKVGRFRYDVPFDNAGSLRQLVKDLAFEYTTLEAEVERLRSLATELAKCWDNQCGECKDLLRAAGFDPAHEEMGHTYGN